MGRALSVSLLIFLFTVSVPGTVAGAVKEKRSFTEFFLSEPTRMQSLPQEDDLTRRLLKKFRPRIFVAPGSYLPIHFYRDYLPRSVVRETGFWRKEAYQRVDRHLLKKIQYNSQYYLDFLPSVQMALAWTEHDVTPTLFGRVYRDQLIVDDKKTDLLFVKYSLVLPYSGLPEKISWLKNLGSSLIGSRLGWHELDIHVAVYVVLQKRTQEPLAVILAQHNHHRVFLRDLDFDWPPDNHPLISLAKYSNEPYLITLKGNDRYERTVGNPRQIEYLFGRVDKAPLSAGLDHVYTPKTGAREVKMQLQLLPLDDPLYTATICLGDKKRVWGIWNSWYFNGPPGINFYSHPKLKNLADLMAFWYVDPKDDAFFQLYKENSRSFYDFEVAPVLRYQKRRLLNILEQAALVPLNHTQ